MGKSIKQILLKPTLLFMTFGHRGWFNWMNDELYLKIAYRISTGKKLNLDNPLTFNEKLQWLKLYDRNPFYTTLVDKCDVKKYVSKIIGEEYIIETLGVWEKFDDIDFNKLPDQFVLKCTHDSGGLVICNDKSKLDINKARKKITRCLGNNFYNGLREWPYKNVKPRIIAEKYMTDESGYELKDYKFFCFNSVPKFLKVDFNRQTSHRANYYDLDWNLMPYYEVDYPNDASHKIDQPRQFEKMVEIVTMLSKELAFSRIDLYNVDGQIYFGEITFFPATGMGKIEPEEWNYTIGSWIKLPNKK